MSHLLPQITELEPKLESNLKPTIDDFATKMARIHAEFDGKLPRQPASAVYVSEKFLMDSRPVLAASFQQPRKLQNFYDLQHQIRWLKAMKSGAEFHLCMLKNLQNLSPQEKESILPCKHQLEDLIGKVDVQLSATEDAKERMKLAASTLETVEKWANAVNFYLKSPLEEDSRRALERQLNTCEVNIIFGHFTGILLRNVSFNSTTSWVIAKNSENMVKPRKATTPIESLQRFSTYHFRSSFWIF